MIIFSPGAAHDTFTVDTGEIVFVPKGYLHHIENKGDSETKFAIAFNHEKPEDIGISESTGSFLTKCLEPHSDLEQSTSAISRNPVMIYL
jgi:oxalate decarboxylase